MSNQLTPEEIEVLRRVAQARMNLRSKFRWYGLFSLLIVAILLAGAFVLRGSIALPMVLIAASMLVTGIVFLIASTFAKS